MQMYPSLIIPDKGNLLYLQERFIFLIFDGRFHFGIYGNRKMLSYRNEFSVSAS